jgi:hypothetical protein
LEEESLRQLLVDSVDSPIISLDRWRFADFPYNKLFVGDIPHINLDGLRRKFSGLFLGIQDINHLGHDPVAVGDILGLAQELRRTIVEVTDKLRPELVRGWFDFKIQNYQSRLANPPAETHPHRQHIIEEEERKLKIIEAAQRIWLSDFRQAATAKQPPQQSLN